MPDVLISHAGADRKRAQALAEGLEAEGFSVALEATGALHLTAQRTLAESGCVLVLWSKASAREDSSAALDAAQAFNQGKLLGARLQDVEPPYPYNLLGALDLIDWRGGRDEPHWRDVAHNVHAIVSDKGEGHVVLPSRPVPPPPPPPTPAPRPSAPTPNIFQAPPRRAEPAPAPPPPPPMLVREPEPRSDEPRQLRRPAQHVEESKPDGEGSRIAPIAIAALALVAAGLWGGPRVIEMLNNKSEPAQEDVTDTASAEPPEFARVQPAPEPLPPAPDPAVAGGPLETVATTPEPVAPAEPPKPDPATTLTSLEKCLASLAKQCGRLDPPIAQSFKTDGAMSAGEKRLLGASIFPDKALVTVRNVDACLATKAPAQIARACPTIAAKVEPPVTSVKPAIPPAIKTPEEPPKPIVEAAPGVTISEPKPASQPEL